MIDVFIIIIACIFLIAHPFLVKEIISQVETPPIIRIGLVIMTYPIFFPVIYFFIKTLYDVFNENRTSWKSILFTLVLLLIVIYSGSSTWQELRLHHQLQQEGVSGIATVQECSKSKGSRGASSCHLEYEYYVRQINKSYRVRESIPCSKSCRSGFSVDITYLPHTPSKAGIEGNTYGLEQSVFILTMHGNVLGVLLIRWLWARLRPQKLE